MFIIKKRSTNEIVKQEKEVITFPKREDAKPMRNELNEKYYQNKTKPKQNHEYFVTRSCRHRLGVVV